MNLFAFKKNSIKQSVLALQILLLTYFTLNIINVGEMGTALPLLAGFVALASLSLSLSLTKGRLTIKLHFLVFILFVAWVSFRVIVDLQDLEYLKQVTIATTGGMLLFFLLGAFSREALNKVMLTDKASLAKALLFLFAIGSFLVFISFKERILERSDIFYISGVDGGYQRPGNFMIMLFFMASFLYLVIAASSQTKKLSSIILWLAVYSSGMMFSLMSSQMIGSNAATANILAIYSMTVVVSFLAFSKSIRRRFLHNQLSRSLIISKFGLIKTAKYSFFCILVGISLAFIALQLSGFDLNKTRAFGFGSGENISISSRVEILKESGMAQMGYAPIFGNVDVARLTTGEAGRTLHNFIPNVIAELGLFGLVMLVVLFSMLVRSLVIAVQQKTFNPSHDYKMLVLNFWLFFILFFLFLCANISVGYSWSVMWFFVGFSMSVFNDRANDKEMKICAVS